MEELKAEILRLQEIAMYNIARCNDLFAENKNLRSDNRELWMENIRLKKRIAKLATKEIFK